MSKYYVYEYVDPRNGLPFYIGKGIRNRILHHLTETEIDTENLRKFKYIESLRSSGLEPIIRKIHENLNEDIAYMIEDQYIIKYGRKGIDPNGILMNICLGQKPPVKYGKDHHNYGKSFLVAHTEETKKKISESKKGQPSWHKGRKKSAEFKKKVSTSHAGKILSDATKQKLSEINSGSGNPNFGTKWITDGIQNNKINKGDIIPPGWRLGRILKKYGKRK